MQVRAVGKVAVIGMQARMFQQVVDARRGEHAGPALDRVNLVTLVEQQFGQIAAILARDAGEKCGFFCHCSNPDFADTQTIFRDVTPAIFSPTP